MLRENKTFVIGHKNPDTDSICSAIAYAALKNKLGEGEFVAKRAGEVNNETKYVLDYFGVETPAFIAHVGTQVKDVNVKPTPVLTSDISLKNAWNTMRDLQESTMPVVDDESGRLQGIISVKDIATANMDIYETRILAMSKTKYSNVLDAINGTMIVGDPNEEITKGKILIGAANPDLLENYVEDGDMLLTGNRFENQLCGIEMDAGCIVVCTGAPISKTIQKLAVEKGCKIISTPHDTYMVARLISQSAPVRYFMKKDNLITFSSEDFISDIKDKLAKVRHRDFPVLDREGHYCGMLSRRSLLAQENNDNGGKASDINDPDYFIDCYEVVRELTEDGIIMAGVTVADGGLMTAAARMCGGLGCDLDISRLSASYQEDDTTKILFGEVPGILIQINDCDYDYLDSQLILQDVAYYPIGRPSNDFKGIRFSSGRKADVAGILASLLEQATEGED